MKLLAILAAVVIAASLKAELPVRDTLTCENAVAVTPSDSVGIFTLAKQTTTKLWVGGTGNVTVLMKSGQVVQFPSVPANTLLPISITRVNATGTSATNMVALY